MRPVRRDEEGVDAWRRQRKRATDNADKNTDDAGGTGVSPSCGIYHSAGDDAKQRSDRPYPRRKGTGYERGGKRVPYREILPL